MKKRIVLILIIVMLVVLATILIFQYVSNKKESWKSDNIVLMQHETGGDYGCFGCSEPKEGQGLCIDPILEMKLVEETTERHCSSEFEVI